MNINLLIDSLVRQTTILIAHLATAAGSRAQLSTIANQVFIDLIRELKEQGVGNKVIADMFGLSLRNYHYKVRRMIESNTERGRSLWEALLDYIQKHDGISRGDILMRFRYDDETTVRGILKDLTASGIVYRAGRGDSSFYRAASPQEQQAVSRDKREGLVNLLWVAISNNGPLSRSQLLDRIPADEMLLDQALDTLVRENRVICTVRQSEPRYRCETCVIPMGDTAGWEAAVFDHYQAVVTAICAKLRSGKRRATKGESIGGSTYEFDICEEHPFHDEVIGFLQSMRDRAVDLRNRVVKYNATHRIAENKLKRVIAYVGQTVIDPDEKGELE